MMQNDLPLNANNMLTLDAHWEDVTAEPKASAVAVLLIPNDSSGWSLVLTKRSTKVGTHKGQVSLAGGRRNLDDLKPVDTALREVHEELGIDPQLVRTLARLNAIKSLDGSAIVPILMTAQLSLENMTTCSIEVDHAFAVPTEALSLANRLEFQFNIFGQWRRSSLYQWKEQRIWGLTALIIDQLKFST